MPGRVLTCLLGGRADLDLVLLGLERGEEEVLDGFPPGFPPGLGFEEGRVGAMEANKGDSSVFKS